MKFRISALILCLVFLFNMAVFADTKTETAAVFAGEKKVFSGTLKAAVDYANFNPEYSYIKLSGDVRLDGGFTLEPNMRSAGTIVAEGNVTVDLNGSFCTQSAGAGMSENALFTVKKGSHLTIKDSSESGGGIINGVQYAVRADGGELTIDGGMLKAQSQASVFPDVCEIPVSVVGGGSLLMNGGKIEYSGTLSDGREYSFGTSAAVFADSNSMLNFNGGTVNGEILCGNAANVRITAGRFSTDVAEFIGEGFRCVESGGMYTVETILPKAAAYFDGEEFESELTSDESGYVISAKSRTGYRDNTKVEFSEVLKAAVRSEKSKIRIETDVLTVNLDKAQIKKLANAVTGRVYFSAERSEPTEAVLKLINTAKCEVEYGFFGEDGGKTVDFGTVKPEVSYVSKTIEKNVGICFVEEGKYTAAKKVEYSGTEIVFESEPSARVAITEGKAAAIQGKALDLKGSVTLVFYARLDGIDTDSARMLFWTSPQTEYTEETAERIVKATGKSALGYKFEYENIASKDMNTEVYARISATGKDGKRIYGDEPREGYSIVKYASNMMKDEKLKPLLTAMLNYGTAAQEYFGTEGEAVNRVLPEYEKSIDFTRIYESEASTIADSEPKCESEIKGKTLTLDGDISINYYTMYGDTSDLEYGMLFWSEHDFEGTDKHVIGTETYRSTDYEINNDYIVFSYKNIVSSAMNDRIYARLYVRNGESCTYSDIDSYSVGDYAANQITKNSDQKLIKLMRALMIYGDAAKKYFSPDGN